MSLHSVQFFRLEVNLKTTAFDVDILPSFFNKQLVLSVGGVWRCFGAEIGGIFAEYDLIYSPHVVEFCREGAPFQVYNQGA